MRIREMLKTLSLIRLLAEMEVLSQWKDRYVFLSLTIIMVIQNMVFFSIWLVYFTRFRDIGGWHVEEMATLFGTIAFGFGLAFLFCGGAMDIGRVIREGELDTYLGRPRKPLLPLVMREARPASLGDMISGPMLWFLFGGHTIADLPLLLALGILSGMITLAVSISVQSLIFYAGQIRTLPDQLFELFLMSSSYPQQGHGPLLRVVIFTVIPAGFAAWLPVMTMASFDWWKVGLMLVAGFFYLALARHIFYRGLGLYASGNGWVAPS